MVRTAARVPVGLLGPQLLEGGEGHVCGVHGAGRDAAVALRPVRGRAWVRVRVRVRVRI